MKSKVKTHLREGHIVWSHLRNYGSGKLTKKQQFVNELQNEINTAENELDRIKTEKYGKSSFMPEIEIERATHETDDDITSMQWYIMKLRDKLDKLK